MRRGIALPLAGLVTIALAVGVRLGVDARVPSETEIIEAAAEDYVAETGGARTDCYARPSPVDGVRLVVTCEPEGGARWLGAYDARGRAVAVDPETLDEEPAT
ncbi:hypothetical protein P6F26_11705 [Roseibacterium sp. SDUM158017]|uniref:hypothetical protein n=1 Tax=Roseicyclus salinarum TaxID=3036773 RepID=UPI002414F274|nr:hypothetical protein [Roseibacterium sp. SDUM158017]MDG4649112.1 hypothetical protein [Roseibacterium sp. SDUM158017]